MGLEQVYLVIDPENGFLFFFLHNQIGSSIVKAVLIPGSENFKLILPP